MKLRYTLEEIEKWRDRVYRRSPRLAVKTKRQTLDFIEDVGFCFAFKSVNSELPCLWHAAMGQRAPVMPHHIQSDPFVSFVWEMKNVLPSEGLVYYGKVLKRRPTFVSLEYFPHFFSLMQRTGTKREYEHDFMRGALSPVARSIMDALSDSSPQVTRGLKLAVGKSSRRERAEFDRAMAELQMKMYIVKVAEHYDPFTFEWELVHKVFASQVRKARKIPPDVARIRILEKYFQNQLVGSVASIARLFGWDRQTIYQMLGTLVSRGIVTPDIKVDGKRSTSYCLIT